MGQSFIYHIYLDRPDNIPIPRIISLLSHALCNMYGVLVIFLTRKERKKYGYRSTAMGKVIMPYTSVRVATFLFTD